MFGLHVEMAGVDLRRVVEEEKEKEKKRKRRKEREKKRKRREERKRRKEREKKRKREEKKERRKEREEKKRKGSAAQPVDPRPAGKPSLKETGAQLSTFRVGQVRPSRMDLKEIDHGCSLVGL